MKTVVKENRASAEYAKMVFEGLYSDKDVLITCARLLADSIFTAHHISSSCWTLTIFPDKIRLNVGPVEVLVLSSSEVFLVIADFEKKYFDENKYRDFVTESEIHYSSVQIKQRRCYVPPEAIGDFYPLIHENHDKFIQVAAKNRTSTTWKSSFSSGVIHYLNNLLGITLPMPTYFSNDSLGNSETNQKTVLPRYWWFGVNNINKRSGVAKNHVIYPELIPLLDGSQKEFEWRYHNKSKRFYESMQPNDKVVFWMGDGDNPNWGIFGFGRVSRIQQNVNPALRRYFLSIDFIPPNPITPYPSKHPQETETTKFLLNLFGLNFRPLGKTFRNLGYDTVRTIITIDEVESEKYNALLEYAQNPAYIDELEFQENLVSGSKNQRNGAGFGNSETNRKVEQAAISFVTNKYAEDGWTVKSVESEKRGFDLLCTKASMQEYVEVKGIQGEFVSFIVTAGEVRQSQINKSFVLCVVTSALAAPKLHKFTAKEFNEQFSLETISYRASLKQK